MRYFIQIALSMACNRADDEPAEVHTEPAHGSPEHEAAH